MTFWDGLKYVHRESWLFLLACPLLALIPIFAELAQHVAEMQIGMYDGPEGPAAAERDPLRLGFGFMKTLAIGLMVYPVIRFLAGVRDAAAARTLEGRAVRLFLLVFTLNALLAALGLFVFTSGPIAIGFFVFGLLFAPLVARFFVAAPLGKLITPQRSIGQMWRQLPWAAAFNIVAALPLMILHYALGIGAVFAPEWAKWPLLIADSLLVGWLAALIAAISWVIATRKDPPPELAHHGIAARAAG